MNIWDKSTFCFGKNVLLKIVDYLNNNLKQHMALNTGEKLYKCETCGKYFTHSGRLKKHYKINYKAKLTF